MPIAAISRANDTSSSTNRRRRRAPASRPPAEPKRPSGSMVQARRGELPFFGVGGALRILLKTVGTLVVSAVAVMVMTEAPVAPAAKVTLAGVKAHDTFSGSAEQPMLMVPVKPPV